MEVILAHVLKKTKEYLFTHPEYELTSTQQKKFNALIARRLKHEPVAYIVGHKEFYGLDFMVNKHTLVPRPETELLVEQALKESSRLSVNSSRSYIIDVGTGSGNIIISIAKTLESMNHEPSTVNYFGVDISNDALKVAKKNARLNGVDKKIKILQSDLLSNFNNVAMKQCDNVIVVANLPYLSNEIYRSAPTDVKKYEPKSALFSAKAGLDHYEKLLKQISNLHVKGQESKVKCFLEISPEQKKLLEKIIQNIFPFAKIEFFKDLAGKWRVCKIVLS